MSRKTVSLYLLANKWDMCKEFGFNMSEEVDKLMDLLLATSLTDNDPEAIKTLSRRHKLEKELRLIEKRKTEMTEEYGRVVEQDNRYKMKLAQIEENKKLSKLLREFNKIIARHEYSFKEVMADSETEAVIEQLSEYEDWPETKVLQQINRVRKYMEGF